MALVCFKVLCKHVDVGFSFCLILFFKVNCVQFLYNRILFDQSTQAFASATNTASSGVKENVTLCK